MARPSITMPDHIADPYFCEDKEDFYKLCLSECRAHSRDTEDMTMYMIGLRIVLHEYLALVLSKKMEPYEEDEAWVENEREGFKGMIDMINEYYAGIGVPIREGENGRIKVDYKKLKEMIEDRDGED